MHALFHKHCSQCSRLQSIRSSTETLPRWLHTDDALDILKRSAIVTHARLFPTRCTHEAGGARPRATSPAAQLHFPTTCSSSATFSHGGHDNAERQGGTHRAHTAPLLVTQRSPAAGAHSPYAFIRRELLLHPFLAVKATRSAFLQGQIRNPLVFAPALLTVVAHVLQRLAFEWLALRVLLKRTQRHVNIATDII